MKGIVFLLTLLLITESFRGQCSLGCLSCKKTTDITFACSVCDLHNNFAMNEEMKCVESQIENCEIPSADHTSALCLRCKSGYVLDQTQKKCVQVSEFHKVDNCLDYLALNHCQTCEPDYYINAGLCAAIGTNKIDDCESYSSDLSQCLSCDSGKFLNSNACEAITAVENCSLYSETICDECTSGFLHEKNYYSSSTMDSKLAHEIIINKETNDQRVMPPLPTVCIEQNIPNCIAYVNFSFCGKCAVGFFLDAERNCIKNPDNEIPNCMTYSDEVTCIECNVEFFLASNECQERTMVDNCLSYEVNSGICLECSTFYYLDTGANTCEERVLSKHIEFCEERDMFFDTCKTCKNRFLLTSDSLACKFQIENCVTYSGTSTLNTTQLLCNVCANDFYTSTDKTECLPQDIINCVNYIANTNECQLCNNGLYYDTSTKLCITRTAENCATVSQTDDVCVTCLPGFYMTIPTATDGPECLEYTISNCNVPETNLDECITCFANYFLKDKDCYAYNIVGCLDFKPDENHCLTCNSGFYLSNNTCLKNNVLNCQVASSTANVCLTCEIGYYINGNTCTNIYVPNCITPSTSLNECLPGQCKTGFYLDGSKQCIKITQPNCSVVDTTNGNCTTCETGFVSSGTNKPCVVQYKPFCLTYSPNTNNCSGCDVGYFLENDSCFPQNLPGCNTFVDTISNDCSVCDTGYYLLNAKCIPLTIQNCLTPVADKDECSACLTDFYLHPDTKSCIIPSVPNCLEPDTANLFECTTCVQGFGLNAENKCEPIHLAENCLVAADTNSATTTPYECEICAKGYYSDTSTKVCTAQSIAPTDFCVEAAFNQSLCRICKSGYSPGTAPSMTCAPITGCVISDGIGTECVLCENDQTNTAGTCAAGGSTDSIDDLCIGNAGTTVACSMCKKDHSLYQSDNTKLINFIPYCLTFDTASPYDCKQCSEDYEITSVTVGGSPMNICEKPSDPENNLCVLKTPTASTTDLSDGSDCLKCNPNASLFDSSGTCTPRTKLNIQNCARYDPLADDCTSCKKGYYIATSLSSNAYCLFNVDGDNSTSTLPLPSIGNCEVHDLAANLNGSDLCLVCEQGYELATLGTTCVKITIKYQNYYYDQAENYFISKKLATAKIDNASIMGRINDTIDYMKCNDGYVASVEQVTHDPSMDFGAAITGAKFTFYDKLNDEKTIHGARIAINSCIQISAVSTYYIREDGYADSPTPPLVEAVPYLENCLLGKQGKIDVSITNFFCGSCKKGYNPILVTLQSESSNINTSDFPFTVVTCPEKTEEFVKKYKGLSPDYGPVLGTTIVTLTELINFDSCANGDILVASMKAASGDTHATWEADADAFQHPGLTCVPFISPSSAVENCHMYIADPAVDISNSASGIKCIACKPGFSATLTGTSVFPTACTPIKNCDISDPSKNTFLNNCETCKVGYGWDYGVSDDQFHKNVCEKILLVDGYVNEHCKVGNSATCYFCEKGYELNERSFCVPTNKTANGCTNYGIARSYLSYSDITSTNQAAWIADNTYVGTDMPRYAFIDYFLNDGQTSNAYGCGTCSTDFSSFSGSTGAPISCLEIEDLIPGTYTPIVENCEESLYTDKTLCKRCLDGYTVKADFSECLESVGVLENCIEQGATDCSICKDGYILADNSCILPGNCELWSGLSTSSYLCAVCKPGFMPDFSDTSNRTCVKSTPDDPCTRWAPAVGCLACANGRTPITIYDDLKSPFARCSDKDYKKFDDSTDHDFKGSIFQIKYDGSAFKNEVIFPASALATLGEFYVITASGPNYAEVCVPNFTIENCDEYGNDNKCIMCITGYAPEGPFECIKGEIEGCLNYSDSETCVECGGGFYFDSPTAPVSCLRRQNYKDCLITDKFADECVECQRGFYLDSTSSCAVQTDLNCLKHESSTNICRKCLPGFYIDSNFVCSSVENPGCKLFSTNSGGCIICMDGYYLDHTDNICKRYTFSGCKIYKQNENKCIECEPEFYLEFTTATDKRDDKFTCKERKSKNCLVTNPYDDECFSCQPGMYLNNNICKFYTAQHCSLFHVSEDQCVDCVDGFFRNSSNKCEPNSDPNCKIMGKYNSRCLVCNQGTYFESAAGNNNGKCVLNTKSCKTFNPNANECLTCEEGLWNNNGDCKRYTAINCRLFAINSDQCASCLDKHYLSFDGSCYASSDPNCEIMEIYEDSCLRCYSGYFINDTKNCEPYTVLHCKYLNPLKNACLLCNNGYYLDNDMDCQLNSQKNCLGYIHNENSCASCQPGHYFANGACNEYTIENCREFDQYADNCLVCEDETYKMKNECKNYTAENCMTYNPLLDHCASCKPDFYLQQGICHDYTIENCKNKHLEADMCLECDEGDYFRNGLGKCEDVTQVANCLTYKKFFDECLTCEPTHYMKNSECIANPSGVYQCKNYATEELCAVCNAPYYLKENVCYHSTVIIPNCEYYSFDGICGECEINHFLITNACVANTNTTCLVNSSPENCSKCGDNEVLDTSGSTFICTASGITDCLIAEYSTEPIENSTITNLCTKCSPGFYLQDNACTASTAVSDCFEYETDLLCAKCNPTFILSKDKTSCTAIGTSAGANCSIARNTAAPECIVCKEGYFFNDEGVCTECQVTGCAICDVINLRKCKLCKSGFQMTELFYCETISFIENDQPTIQRMENDHSNTLEKLSSKITLVVLVFFFAWNKN